MPLPDYLQEEPHRPPQPLGPGLLLNIPLLAALPVEQAQELAAQSFKRRYMRGEYILEQGQHGHSLYILLQGKAHVLRTDNRGREVILDVLRTGDHAGEMCLIDNQPHSASVRCETNCDVLELPGAVLARTLPDRPVLSWMLMRTLVKRLRRAHRQINSLALKDVPGRVMRALHDMSEPEQIGSRIVRERVSRHELARMVGASREMVSRVVLELATQGKLELRDDGGVRLLLPNKELNARPPE